MPVSHELRFAEAALGTIEPLYRFLAEQNIPAAEAALIALENAWDLLRQFPFPAREADPAKPLLRELLIPFGGAGYMALYEIDDGHTVTILAARHQREDDYH